MEGQEVSVKTAVDKIKSRQQMLDEINAELTSELNSNVSVEQPITATPEQDMINEQSSPSESYSIRR